MYYVLIFSVKDGLDLRKNYPWQPKCWRITASTNKAVLLTLSHTIVSGMLLCGFRHTTLRFRVLSSIFFYRMNFQILSIQNNGINQKPQESQDYLKIHRCQAKQDPHTHLEPRSPRLSKFNDFVS